MLQAQAAASESKMPAPASLHRVTSSSSSHSRSRSTQPTAFDRDEMQYRQPTTLAELIAQVGGRCRLLLSLKTPKSWATGGGGGGGGAGDDAPGGNVGPSQFADKWKDSLMPGVLPSLTRWSSSQQSGDQQWGTLVTTIKARQKFKNSSPTDDEAFVGMEGYDMGEAEEERSESSARRAAQAIFYACARYAKDGNEAPAPVLRSIILGRRRTRAACRAFGLRFFRQLLDDGDNGGSGGAAVGTASSGGQGVVRGGVRRGGVVYNANVQSMQCVVFYLRPSFRGKVGWASSGAAAIARGALAAAAAAQARRARRGSAVPPTGEGGGVEAGGETKGEDLDTMREEKEEKVEGGGVGEGAVVAGGAGSAAGGGGGDDAAGGGEGGGGGGGGANGGANEEGGDNLVATSVDPCTVRHHYLKGLEGSCEADVDAVTFAFLDTYAHMSTLLERAVEDREGDVISWLLWCWSLDYLPQDHEFLLRVGLVDSLQRIFALRGDGINPDDDGDLDTIGTLDTTFPNAPTPVTPVAPIALVDPAVVSLSTKEGGGNSAEGNKGNDDLPSKVSESAISVFHLLVGASMQVGRRSNGVSATQNVRHTARFNRYRTGLRDKNFRVLLRELSRGVRCLGGAGKSGGGVEHGAKAAVTEVKEEAAVEAKKEEYKESTHWALAEEAVFHHLSFLLAVCDVPECKASLADPPMLSLLLGLRYTTRSRICRTTSVSECLYNIQCSEIFTLKYEIIHTTVDSNLTPPHRTSFCSCVSRGRRCGSFATSCRASVRRSSTRLSLSRMGRGRQVQQRWRRSVRVMRVRGLGFWIC